MVVLGLPRQGGRRGIPLSTPPSAEPPPGPLWRRLAWMAAIWATSVAALGVVAFVLRLWITPS
ncbi:DUF2474 domain-containing protein [Tsuneonella deserti]|uniref:DUF2474 domain-containing protein n=1 Tax=Tsuneonella deserti TaxID=2035528 RepID=UPI003570F31F